MLIASTSAGVDHGICEECLTRINTSMKPGLAVKGPADSLEARMEWARKKILEAVDKLISDQGIPKTFYHLLGAIEMDPIVTDVVLEIEDLNETAASA